MSLAKRFVVCAALVIAPALHAEAKQHNARWYFHSEQSPSGVAQVSVGLSTSSKFNDTMATTAPRVMLWCTAGAVTAAVVTPNYLGSGSVTTRLRWDGAPAISESWALSDSGNAAVATDARALVAALRSHKTLGVELSIDGHAPQVAEFDLEPAPNGDWSAWDSCAARGH